GGNSFKPRIDTAKFEGEDKYIDREYALRKMGFKAAVDVGIIVKPF
ncbi:hypothetical protein H5T51_02325, partial [Candidatus Bathyarchaeota archaeon]|nr:hypothetical protein [Candidatus Bathyarchaeota archaeon]